MICTCSDFWHVAFNCFYSFGTINSYLISSVNVPTRAGNDFMLQFCFFFDVTIATFLTFFNLSGFQKAKSDPPKD